jgi:hypothetical protein
VKDKGKIMSEKKKDNWKTLKKIIEFFWPYYSPFTKEQIQNQKKWVENYSREKVEPKFENIQDEKTIDFMLDQAEKLFDDEDRRVESVERKCAIITGFSGVAIMLSFGFIETLFSETSMNTSNVIFLFLMFFFVNIYLITALIYSVEGIKKRNYFRVEERDFIGLPTVANPKKQMAVLYIEKRVKNFRAINLKVDSMHFAILFFKRALITALIFAVAIFIFNIYPKVSSNPPEQMTPKVQAVIKANPSP